MSTLAIKPKNDTDTVEFQTHSGNTAIKVQGNELNLYNLSSDTDFSSDKFPGHVIQHAYTQTGSVATGTTIFPEDDTIPQITEGTEFMTLEIIPKFSTSTLSIEVHIFYSQSTGTRSGTGLFKNNDTNALAFTSNYIHGATSMGNMQVFYSETSSNTTARTYKVRCGLLQNSGTFTFNGQSGARKFGGTSLSTMRIMEIAG